MLIVALLVELALILLDIKKKSLKAVQIKPRLLGVERNG